MAKQKDVVIFYSWQTDSPSQTNRSAIRHALRRASSSLEKHFSAQELKINIEEATRNEPGSPNIPQRLLQKIDGSDLFVCDVTTINVSASNVFRKTPNPNVLFELGYAVGLLGWGRIIMLFNTALGDCSDLPFDIDRQRVSQYTLKESSGTADKKALAELDELVTLAIGTILEKNPAKNVRFLNPEQVRRQRDVKTLEWLLRSVHWPTLEEHLSAAPRFIDDACLYFFDAFDSITKSTSFHLYDEALLLKIIKVHHLWAKSLSFYHHYESQIGANRSVFTTVLTTSEKRDWKQIEWLLSKLGPALNDLLHDLRERYLEVDVEDLSNTAWNNYVIEHHKAAESLALSLGPKAKIKSAFKRKKKDRK